MKYLFLFIFFISYCKPSTFKSACDPTSNSFKAYMIIKFASNDKSSFCNSGTQLQSGTSTVPVTVIPTGPFTIGGTITGLFSTGLIISSGTTPNQTVSPILNATNYQFANSIPSGSTYSITITTQPSFLNCTVSNPTGTITTNLTNINITCALNPPLPLPHFQWLFDNNYASSTANVSTGTPTLAGSGPSVAFNSSIFKQGTNSAFFGTTSGAYSNGGRIAFPAYDFGNLFTISGWINIIATDPSYTQKLHTVFSNKTGGGANGMDTGFSIFIHEFANENRILHFNTGNGVSEVNVKTQNNILTYNTWTYVTFVINKTSGTVKIYTNGIPVSLSTTNLILTNFNTNAVFRMGSVDSFYHFSGYLDDFRVYNVLLNDVQVLSLYNSF